jgi:hypothetical protein
MRERFVRVFLIALTVQLPFEFRSTLLGLSNLQWTFIALLLFSVPDLFVSRNRLASDRLVQAAAVFVTLQWFAAAIAPEFQTNAFKAAARFTAGFLVFAIVRLSGALKSRAWIAASTAAAVYALVDYAGFGAPSLFRTQEFFTGQVQRLSGSFEYPNTAAAYFAMSIPIVWFSAVRIRWRAIAVLLLSAGLILTLSKGAPAAVLMVILAGSRRRAIPLIGMGAAAYAALSLTNPYLIERILNADDAQALAVEYTTEWNNLEQKPETIDAAKVTIRNRGVSALRSEGRLRSQIGTRWWRMDTRSFIAAEPVVTPLALDIHRGETLTIDASFHTPTTPGRYVLVLELFSRDFDWYSRTGIRPVLIEADIRPDASRKTSNVDLTHLYNRGIQSGTITANTPRSSLWKAALLIFVTHPFGAGPDNFRLIYGRYLNASRWDTNIYANNLYLEILTGSGFLGLAAFVWMLGRRQWVAGAASLAAAVFLIHGLVDVFLMATPIYFTFWMLVAVKDQ